MKYKKVVVGGTFDYLHDGHKAILAEAFKLGGHVLVCVCSDEMELTKDSAGVQPLEVRRRSLDGFLRSRGWLGRAEIHVISDPFGPAVSDAELQAIVVSPETHPRADELNKLRFSCGRPPLDVIEIPFVLAEDGSPISSIRIRYGEMDIHGKLLCAYRP